MDTTSSSGLQPICGVHMEILRDFVIEWIECCTHCQQRYRDERG